MESLALDRPTLRACAFLCRQPIEAGGEQCHQGRRDCARVERFLDVCRELLHEERVSTGAPRDGVTVGWPETAAGDERGRFLTRKGRQAYPNGPRRPTFEEIRSCRQHEEHWGAAALTELDHQVEERFLRPVHVFDDDE